MGDFEMINLSTGDRLRIDKDGSEIRDEITPPDIEWCDRGQHYAARLGGTGWADILWICLQCRK